MGSVSLGRFVAMRLVMCAQSSKWGLKMIALRCVCALNKDTSLLWCTGSLKVHSVTKLQGGYRTIYRLKYLNSNFLAIA
jgi:hypothetical protein